MKINFFKSLTEKKNLSFHLIIAEKTNLIKGWGEKKQNTVEGPQTNPQN